MTAVPNTNASSEAATGVSESKNAETARTAQRTPEAKYGEYICQRCQKQFGYQGGELKCPKCGAEKADNLNSIYTEDEPSSEGLGTEDFSGGD